MPAERAAAAGRLEVEFGVIEADAAAQQARDDIDNLLAANRLRENIGRLFRIGDAPQRRAAIGDGDNVVMLVASQFAVADGGDNARDFALQAAQQIGRREIFDHGESVAPIARFDGVEIGSVFHRIFLRDFAFYYTHAAAFCKGLARKTTIESRICFRKKISIVKSQIFRAAKRPTRREANDSRPRLNVVECQK